MALAPHSLRESATAISEQLLTSAPLSGQSFAPPSSKQRRKFIAIINMANGELGAGGVVPAAASAELKPEQACLLQLQLSPGDTYSHVGR